MKGVALEMLKFFRKPKNAVLAAIFYSIILISAFAVAKLFSAFFFRKEIIIHPAMALAGLLAYFIIIALAYSFFKIAIFEAAAGKRITKKPFSRLGGFLIFNAAALGVGFLAASILGSLIVYSLYGSAVAGAVFLAVFMVFFYPFLLFSQLEFLENGKTFRSMGVAWKKLFSHRLGSYFKLLLANAFVICAFMLLVYLAGSIYKVVFINNNSDIGIYVSAYNFVFSLLLAAIALLLLSFNAFYIRKIKG